MAGIWDWLLPQDRSASLAASDLPMPGGLPVARPGGVPAADPAVQALFSLMLPNTGASAAAAALPMPTGLPAPRMPATPLPVGPAAGEGAPDFLRGIVERLRSLAQQSQQAPITLPDVARTVAGVPPATAAPAPPVNPMTFSWGPSQSSSPASRTISIPGTGSGGGDLSSVIASYVPAMLQRESGNAMVPNAAGASSAFGPAQFIDSTWIETVRKHDPEAAKLDDKTILAKRADSKYHNLMALNFTMDNAAQLQQEGIPVNNASLYAMHFFGAGDAPKVLKAAPDTPLSEIVDAKSIAANPILKGKTAGWAQQWAGNFGASTGGGMPGAPALQAAQIPAPPTLQAPAGLDLSKVEDLMAQMKPLQAEPMGTADKITAVLAGMAGGAANARNIGELFAGAGAGAAGAAAGNVQQARREKIADQRAKQDYLQTMAQFGMTQAQMVQSNKNLTIETANKNAQNLYERNVQQAQLDAQTKNRVAELQHQVDWKAYEEGKPQVAISKEAVTQVKRKPDGGMDITTVKLGGDDNQTALDKMDELRKAGQKDSPLYKSLEYSLVRNDPIAYRRKLLEDATEGGLQKEILGTQYDNVRKLVTAGLTGTDPKTRDAMEKERWLNVLMTMLTNGQLRDENWIPMMVKSGNVGAKLLAPQPGNK